MGVHIIITTLKQGYVAGETVEGTLAVNVTDTNGMSADELFLGLKGRTSGNVMKVTDKTMTSSTGTYTVTDRYIVSQSTDILEYELQLGKFGDRAEVGNHVFPFAIVLPSNLPSSMKEKAADGSNCSIEYCLKGKLKQPGLANFEACGEQKIEVFARPKLFEPRPVLAGPDSTGVKFCCFFRRGSMSVGFQAERAVVSRNEVLGVTVVARNDSGEPIEELILKLCQNSRWVAHDTTKTKKRTLASLKVPSPQLGDVEKSSETGKKNGGRRVLGAASSTTLSELEQLLTSGAGVRHELVVPEDCADTMESELIVVRHLITVKLKCPAFVASPDVWTPIVIQTSADAAAGVGSQPVTAAPPATRATPHAVGLDAEGNPVPVLVPEDCLDFELDEVLDPSMYSSRQYRR